MRWLVVFACGCNSILGLRDDFTRRPPSDAQFFDTPADAAFTCPPIGTAPTFKHGLHATPLIDCHSYSISHRASLAVTFCGPYDSSAVSEGPIEGEVAPVQIVDTAAYNRYYEPRLASDGDELVRMRWAKSPDLHYTFEIDHRDAPLVWTPIDLLPFSVLDTGEQTNPCWSNITGGADRRALVIDDPAGSASWILHEYSNTGAGWVVHDSYPVTLLQTTVINTPALTADGLRLVFTGVDGIRYADRPSLSDRFGPSQLLTGGVPTGVDYPVLDDDCGKLYFSALDTVFFVEQVP
jgi:hypothetical protein